MQSLHLRKKNYFAFYQKFPYIYIYIYIYIYMCVCVIIMDFKQANTRPAKDQACETET